MMGRCGLKFASIKELFSQAIERLWMVSEVLQIKNRLGRRQVILLQIVVEPDFGRSEVGDASRNTCPGTSQNHHFLEQALFQTIDHLLVRKLLLSILPQSLIKIWILALFF